MPAYLLEPRVAATQRYTYVGLPHDAATSLGNPGARFAPAALRGALRDVFNWRLREGKFADVDEGIIDLSAVEVQDAGDVALSYHDTERAMVESYTAVREVLHAGCFPIVVGGDHGISYPAIRALHDTTAGQIGIIQLDAHNDLMDYSDRQGWLSGSSGMRRSLDLPRVAPENFVALGLRGYATVEQYTVGQELGVHRITGSAVERIGALAAAQQALAWASAGTDAVYLTVDMDVINPGEAPGTGWPEPGGLRAQEVITIIRALAPHVAALDIAELNPLFDTAARTTALLAARLVLDLITTRVRSGVARGAA